MKKLFSGQCGLWILYYRNLIVTLILLFILILCVISRTPAAETSDSSGPVPFTLGAYEISQAGHFPWSG